KGRKTEDQLEVLREEQKASEHHQDREAVRGQRRTESRLAKKTKVDQRDFESQLAPRERDSKGKSRRNRQHRHQGNAVLRDLLQTEDHRKHGNERQRGTGEIETPRRWIAVLG